MLNEPYQATAVLIALMGRKAIDTPVPREEWLLHLKSVVAGPLSVIAECVDMRIVEELPGETGCVLCELEREDHRDADHEYRAVSSAVRLRPRELAARVLETLSDSNMHSNAPRQYDDAPSFVATARWEGADCVVVLHFGLDGAAAPDAAGNPILQLNFRGGGAIPEPSAITFTWSDLVGDQASRDRALAHVSRSSDVSYLTLRDIEDGLPEIVRHAPRDALAKFLARCGFAVTRGAPEWPYVDQGPLSATVQRTFTRRDDKSLILECTCADHPGWHLHGRRDGRRQAIFDMEARLQRFVARAAQTTLAYRELSSSRERIPDVSGQLLQDAVALVTAVAAVFVAVFGDGLALALGSFVDARFIRTTATLASLAAALFILMPRGLRAFLGWRLLFLRWPAKP
jgi:hypothetical protein